MDGRITGPITKDDAYDVSDPTDWLGTPLASLMQVEQSLRCHVCKDFFNSPVITSCSHTFCSLCIRRALNTDGKCPLCRATDQESKLRGNWAIREAVDTFVVSRGAMLDLARRTTAVDAAAPVAIPKRKNPKDSANVGPTNKRTRLSTRLSEKLRRTRLERDARDEAEDDMNEVEVEESDAEEAEEYIPDDGLVACPICQWRMKAEKVYAHIDTDCPGEPRPQPNLAKPKKVGFATGRSMNATSSVSLERLPSTNYSILNETKLRKKVSDLGIPNWGSRLLLEKRHREWVMIWNANCDSSRPKTKRELLQDLDTWERTQGGQASSTTLSANRTAQIKDKDFDGASWSAKHSDSFSDLIARARTSHKKAGEAPRDASASSEGARGTERHVDAAGHGHSGDAISTEQAPSEDTSASVSAVVDLTSPAKPQEGTGGRFLLSEEHSTTDVNTAVSTFTETPT